MKNHYNEVSPTLNQPLPTTKTDEKGEYYVCYKKKGGEKLVVYVKQNLMEVFELTNSGFKWKLFSRRVDAYDCAQRLRLQDKSSGRNGGEKRKRDNNDNLNDSLCRKYDDVMLDLNEKQKEVLISCLKGRSLFFTGAGGTGKSFVMGKIIESLVKEGKKVLVLGPTGISAFKIGGKTINSAFGFRMIEESTTVNDLVERSNRSYISRALKLVDVVVVDEISMVQGKTFTAMSESLKAAKNVDIAFGGNQVIITGDFFQLPPPVKVFKFVFELDLFRDIIEKYIHLTEIVRQKDKYFQELLNFLRVGCVNEKVLKGLRKLLVIPSASEKLDTIHLLPLKRQVEDQNEQNMRLLPGAGRVYRSFEHVKKNKTRSKRITSSQMNSIFSGCNAQKEIRMKQGVRVVVISNNQKEGWYNGMQGVVEKFEIIKNQGYSNEMRLFLDSCDFVVPVLRADHDGKLYTMKPTRFLYVSETLECERIQIPLKLGWAITIHSSQCMGLKKAFVDLNKCFADSQGYVACSRVEKLEGLKLLSLKIDAFKVSPKVMRFHQLRFPDIYDRKSLCETFGKLEELSPIEKKRKVGDDEIIIIDDEDEDEIF